MIAATWATAKTSPFLFVPSVIWEWIVSLTSIEDAAIAVLMVSVLSDTSTIFARPCSLKCVSSDNGFIPFEQYTVSIPEECEGLAW